MVYMHERSRSVTGVRLRRKASRLFLLVPLLFPLVPLGAQPDPSPKGVGAEFTLPFDRFDLFRSGQFRRSRSFAENEVLRWGSDDHLLRATAASWSGLRSHALRELESIQEDAPHRTTRRLAAYRLGLINLTAGDYEGSRLALAGVVEGGEEYDETRSEIVGASLFWIGVGHLLESHGSALREAESVFRACADEYPSSDRADDALYYHGQIAESTSEREEALGRYGDLLHRYPESRYALAASIRRVQLLHELHRYDAALAELEETETLWDRYRKAGTESNQFFAESVPLELVLLRGEISIGRGDLAGSERAWLTLLYELDGGYRRDGLLALAETYRQAGIDDSALVLYDQILAESIEDRPGATARLFAPLLRATGKNRTSQERSAAEARLAQIAADQSDPMWDAATLALAGIAWNRDDADATFRLSENILASSESNPLRLRASLLSGAASIRLGRPTAAADLLERMRGEGGRIEQREMPDRPEVISAMTLLEAEAQIASGADRAALPLLRQYLRESSDSARFPEILRTIGDAELRSGQTDQGIATFERIVEEYGDSEPVEQTLYDLGWLHLRAGDLRRAEHAFSRLVRAFPTGPHHLEGRIRRADCFYLNEQFEPAARLYEELVAELAENPTRIEERTYALYQGAMATWRSGKEPEAGERFDRFVEEYEESAWRDDATFMSGLIAYRTGQFDEAIGRMQQLLEIDDESPLAARAWYTIADAHYRSGRFDDALAAYSIVTEEYPASTYFSDAETGIVYARAARQKLYDSNRSAELRQVSGEETIGGRIDDELPLRRGAIFLEANRIDDAEREYLAFIAASPDSPNLPEAWLGLADVALARRDTLSALDTLAAMLDRFDEGTLLPVAALRLAELRAVTGDTSGAIAALDRIRIDFPESAPVPLSLLEKSRLLEAGGDVDKAADVLAWGAIRLDTIIGLHTRTGGRILSELARLRVVQGRYEDAAIEWRRLGRRDDSLGGAALVELADFLAMRGEIDEATLLYDRALAILPDDPALTPRILLARGGIDEMFEEVRDASGRYRAILEEWPASVEATEAGRRLRDLESRDDNDSSVESVDSGSVEQNEAPERDVESADDQGGRP